MMNMMMPKITNNIKKSATMGQHSIIFADITMIVQII